MHYYQFHISDWALHTSHLSLEEEGVYRRLLDYYYDTELPIPEETQRVIRRLRLGSYSVTVGLILEEFFTLIDGAWHNLRADTEISVYQAKAETARINGGKGGRPKKQTVKKQKVKVKGKKEKNPEETQRVNLANPAETGSKPNEEPLTINDKPLTINQKPISKEKTLVELKHDDALGIFETWKEKLNHPKAAFDDKRKALIRKALKNYSKEDLLKAVFGCTQSAWHLGDNDRGTKFDSIELILKDAKRIDQFMKLADEPATGNIKTISQTQDAAHAQADRISKHLGFNQ